MVAPTWWEYLAVALGTTAVTLVLTPLALRLALRRQILDHPNDIKAQASPVPYLGGLAIVIAFSAVVGGAALVRPPHSNGGILAVVLGLAVGLAILGAVDDIRGLGPWVRLAAETAAGVVVYLTGTHAQLLDHRLPHGQIFDAVVTVVWVVGVTNAFNILDNMDGLSAGIAGIASLSLFLVAYLNGQFLVATLALALVGCAVGFLRHNFHPAKIYMGDAGSLYLGFLLAVLCLRLRTYNVSRISFFVPVLILGVALFDTTLVTATRLWHHRNPLSGGRDHTSHRLVFVGIPVRATVGIIYGAGAALGWLAVIVARLSEDRTTAAILMGLVLTVAVLLAGLLAAVPVYETSRRRRMMIQEVKAHESEPLTPPPHAPAVPQATDGPAGTSVPA